MHLLPAWGTVYTHKLEMLHSVGYNQHQKTQVLSIIVLLVGLPVQHPTGQNILPRMTSKLSR